MLTGQYNNYYLQSFPRVSTMQNLFTTSDTPAAIYEYMRKRLQVVIIILAGQHER